MASSMDQHDDRSALLERIQELEREVREKDVELKQERRRKLQQEVDNILQEAREKDRPIQGGERYMQKQDSRMQHVLDKPREVQEIEPRHLRQKRRQREVLKERDIKKRQRSLQQERDLALQEAEKKERELQRAKDEERRAKERSSTLLQEKDRAIQRAEERDKQAQERARALQQERDIALLQADERSSALRQEKSRSIQLRMEGSQRALETARALRQERNRADERDKQAQERARALQQERDKLLRQAWQREKEVKQERDKALQRLREIDPLLQPSTLGDFIKECHASLFSKLTIAPNTVRGSEVTTTNLNGKWRPGKVMQWTDFLSEQRLIFDKVCEVFPSELREFPRPTTVRQNGTKIVPIADEKTLERFIDVSIAEPVRNIITKLQSVDKLGRVCPGDVDVRFVIHPDHAKPLEIDSTPSRPVEPEPVRTRYCIYRDGTASMASATSLYVWEPKVPCDLTVEDLRAALRPTAAFGEVAARTESLAFVSKGTVSGHIQHLEHEARVYERLKAIQGRYVPVFLGTIDLRTMDKAYWIYFETYVVHMMFFSWGGIHFHVHRAGMDQLETLHDVPWVDEGVRALKVVHNEGVLHCDVRWGNVLFNSETKGIMVIDFERAELLDGHATGSSEKDTRKEDGLRKTDKQQRLEACNEERAEEEEHEIFSVIEDALGVDCDDTSDSSELEDSDF